MFEVNVSVSAGERSTTALGLATATTEGGAELGLGRGEGARLAAEEQPAASRTRARASVPGAAVLVACSWWVSSSRVSGKSVPVSLATAPDGALQGEGDGTESVASSGWSFTVATMSLNQPTSSDP